MIQKQTPVEIETKRRIRLAVWAYAYEFENIQLVPDYVYDLECLQVNLNMWTNRPDLDTWFRENFNPSTGMWIHTHPQLPRIAQLFHAFYSPQSRMANGF